MHFFDRASCARIVSLSSLLFLSAACAAPEAVEAPASDEPALDLETDGTTWNGWTQSITGNMDLGLGIASYWQTFTRSYGDATRGGGACFVLKQSVACSNDAGCLAGAQAAYGAASYGYCWAGSCYYRPGSQSSWCALSPNRNPGTVGSSWMVGYALGTENVLGCMTKTAGPNTSCGGTDANLYMRTVQPVTYSQSQLP